jgi:hypothetical protein
VDMCGEGRQRATATIHLAHRKRRSAKEQQ